MTERERVIYGVIAEREPDKSHEWVAELAQDINRHLAPEDPHPHFALALSGLAWAVGRLDATGAKGGYAQRVLEQLSSPVRITQEVHPGVPHLMPHLTHPIFTKEDA